MSEQKRYYRVDVDFWHKRTCHALLQEFGPWGPCVWLALIAEAKKGSIPGRVIVTSMEALQERLGLLGYDLGFDLDAFFRATGRLKQTSRTPVGRLTHIVLTRYGDWQRDWKRAEDRERKNTSKQGDSTSEQTAENVATENGESSRSSSTTRSSSSPQRDGSPSEPFACSVCGLVKRTHRSLLEHLADLHGDEAALAELHALEAVA